MIFQDARTLEEFECIGWLPAIQAKRKELTPWGALAFEQEAQKSATSPLNAKRKPTDAEKRAGRYAKGHVDFQGLKIAIENPRGSIRSGKGWSCTMAHHYGYVERTIGADGEGVDVFIGPDLDSDLVVIVNQVNPDRSFDEHKVMLGFGSEDEARRGYLASYTPGWKGLGSTQTCSMDDFKAWLEEGDLQHPALNDVSSADESWLDTVAATFRPVAKAGFAEPNDDGTRWITVHPNGKDQPGHPVRIRPVAGHQGVFHIVGGAEGKLNGLRLQGIKDPADYKAESKARAKEHKKNEAKKKAEFEEKLTPEEKQKHQAQQEEAGEKVKQAQDHLIRTTLEAQGIDPEGKMELEGVDSKLAQTKHRQNLLSHAMKAAKDAERRVSLDAEARAAAGLSTVGGENQPDVDEVLSITDDEHGPGYQRALKAKAKEHGLTPEALAESTEALRLKQAQNRVEDGDFSDWHEQLGEGDPVQGILRAGELIGAQNRKNHMEAKAIKEAHNGAIKEALKEAVTNNEQLAAILRARKELREAVKAQQKGKQRIFEAGYQTRITDLDEAIIQDAADAITSGRMIDFLREVDEAHGDEDDLDLGKPHVEEGLHASRGAGAFDALHEIALASMGQGAIDRDTVEILGPDGAAHIMARALRQAYTPDEQREVLNALEEVHLEEQEQDIPRVMEEVTKLRADAQKVQEDLAGTARDLATATEMQRSKVLMLKEARRQLGGTLGRMEARAALIMALKDAPRDVLTVPLGTLPREQAVTTAAAMGLKEGHYTLDYEKGEGLLTLNAAGQQSLIKPYDQVVASERELAVAIKRGTYDEEGWLPAGFARRSELTSDNPLEEPPMFRKDFAPQGAQTAEDLRQEVEDYIGARFADGDRTSDILMSINNLDAMEAVPEHLKEDFSRIIREVLPLREAITDEQGLPVEDEGRRRTRAVTAETMDQAAEALSVNYITRNGLNEEATYHSQRADYDSPTFSEGIHQALAKNPKVQAGFIPPGLLTKDHQRLVRDYFYENLLGQPSKGTDRDKAGLEAAHRIAGPEPEKMAMDMFGEASTSPEWLEWNERVEAHLEKESPWASFVESMGGLKDAQRSVQEHMRGAFLGHFADHYERATGKAFKRGQVEIHQAPQFLESTGTPEERTKAAEDRRAQDLAMRARRQGQFSDMGGEGALGRKREENRLRGGAAAAETSSMFDMDEFTQPEEGPEAAPEGAEPKIKAGHRLSLGVALESQIYKAMPNALKAMQGQKRGIELRPVSMEGRYGAQQRGVKAITNLRRVGLFYGAGSGKTPIMLGAHAELHKAGKVKKAIYSVPSAVQGQFGAEAATFLDPKSGIYIHANPGETFEERLKAYQDPEAHGVVVTHQALRDDVMKILGKHQGQADPEALKAWVHQAPRAELAKAVKDALGSQGISPDALFLDEGHNALNRAGKEDSTLAKIVDAVGDNASFYAAATADPIKNDASEAYDWLTKMDPRQYPQEKRSEWMARYGKNTSLCRRSMKAELARYYFQATVDPGVVSHQNIASAPVTDSQRQALEAVDKAMAGMRFAKTPEELAAHAAVIDPDGDPELVKKSIGTAREMAYNRILNCDPQGGKVLKTVELAVQSVKEGKPAIVFARNHAAVQAIRKALEAQGHDVVVLTGHDSADQKTQLIKTFQPPGWNHKDPEKRVTPKHQIILMTDAGATGINLQRGQTVIQHDIPMTSMTHTQRTARAFRLGQKHAVTTHTVAADHSFDHTNLRRLKKKEVLSGIYKSAEGSLDDTGTAERLRAIRERRTQTTDPAAA